MSTFLAKREAEREQLLAEAIALLQADTRIVAAWLFGSLGRSEADALSDLDLWVVVEDTVCPEVVATRRDYVSQLATPLLLSEAPQNAPANGGYLLALYAGEAGPHQVDWYWQPRSEAHIPLSVQVLFDKVGLPLSELPPLIASALSLTQAQRAGEATQRFTFFFAMAPIIAKYIFRKNGWTVSSMLQMLQGTLREAQRFTEVAEGRTFPFPTTPAEQLALLREMTQTMAKLGLLIQQMGGDPPLQAVASVQTFFDEIERLLPV